jgi:hypothetical protein
MSQAHFAHGLPTDEINDSTSFDINTTHGPIAYLNPLAGQSEYQKKKKRKSEFILNFHQLLIIFIIPYIIHVPFFIIFHFLCNF